MYKSITKYKSITLIFCVLGFQCYLITAVTINIRLTAAADK
jgi:hypothetical protein